MLFGNYWFDQNIYEFDGKHYTPRWNADPFKKTIGEVKNLLETAYDASPEKSPKGILTVTRMKWEEIKKSYASWTGLAKFHYYDTSVNAGEVPVWMAEADGYNGALVHEYADGKVVYRGDPELIYKFFIDSDAPVLPEEVVVADPVPGSPNPPIYGFNLIEVALKVWFFTIRGYIRLRILDN